MIRDALKSAYRGLRSEIGKIRYREQLKGQWENLCADFAGNFETLLTQGEAPGCFIQWYEARIHRWRSASYPEGIMLEQKANPEFARHLTAAMEDFEFKRVESAGRKSFWPGIILGVAAGLAATFCMRYYVFDAAASGLWSWLGSGLFGAFLFAACSVRSFRRSARINREEDERVKSAYVGQLRDYMEKLLLVCKNYE